ncbi:ATP-binding protein [Candidatus Woesebacteria bacterium]|nr:ATP-binding protein [Candidatus Woesebacteria bacterium]MCD8526736.1 ATP-binding protein [Candidatus Woesebacteria bacterium]MCD8546521.1 ATP-binding protein [Candidatus Woesebacteria bacterium]
MASFLERIGLKKPSSTQGDDAQTQKKQQLNAQMQQFSQGLVSIQDIIAPEAIEVDFTYQKINDTFTRTLFIAGYPRMVPANWLSPLINFPYSLDVSMHITPVDVKEILHDLRRKITEMEAEISSDIRSGKISNIDTEIKLEDAKAIQEQLAKGAERFYQFGLYVTINSPNVEELDNVTKQLQSLLGSMLLISKKSSLQMDEGYKTTLPMGQDKLKILRNMDTTSLATTFPFTSSELTMDKGIVYGLNEHNGSLIIFDRFQMENANMVVFAKSGAGKSYAVKLEALRHMMFGAEVLILDPEKEYEDMAASVGGEYINFAFGSNTKINPFDLSQVYEEGENELGQKIISLHALLKVMLGEMNASQEAMLDRALVATYKAKGITPDPSTQNKEPPLMEDLYKALIGMENDDAYDIAMRLEKYIKGSFRGIFDQHTNIDIRNQMTVFSVRDIEDELRPVAMFMILDFIWTRIRKERKKRVLVVDEAWYFMKHQDTASFMHSIAKRARKYYLGVTTITQDVEDFMHSDYGKAIVTNASMQLLLKQSSAAIPVLADTFYLSEGEQRLLMAADVGEGLFFAGQNHVAMRIMASPEEHVVITTNPQELEQINKAKQQQQQQIQQTTQALKQQNLPQDNYQEEIPDQTQTAFAGQPGQYADPNQGMPQNQGQAQMNPQMNPQMGQPMNQMGQMQPGQMQPGQMDQMGQPMAQQIGQQQYMANGQMMPGQMPQQPLPGQYGDPNQMAQGQAPQMAQMPANQPAPGQYPQQQQPMMQPGMAPNGSYQQQYAAPPQEQQAYPSQMPPAMNGQMPQSGMPNQGAQLTPTPVPQDQGR